MSRGRKTDIYRSKFEQSIAKQLNSSEVDYEYEPKDGIVKYEIPAKFHRYIPDFIITRRDGSRILLEPKGIWDHKDRTKHLLIKQQHPELDIRFIFQRSKQRIRKGSKTTYKDICEGNGRGVWKGVTWNYSDGTIPEEWLEDNTLESNNNNSTV